MKEWKKPAKIRKKKCDHRRIQVDQDWPSFSIVMSGWDFQKIKIKINCTEFGSIVLINYIM